MMPNSTSLSPLSEYNPVGLAQLSRLLYTNRTDAKYVFGESVLSDILSSLKESYSVLEIKGQRVHPYKTIYFDTHDFSLYRQHHNGKLPRYKIRSRQYESTGEVFSEIKYSAKKNMTIKTRIPRETLNYELDSNFGDFIASTISPSPGELVLSLEVLFNRVTLVDNSFAERITIDTGLVCSFHGKSCTFPSLTIVEVKKNRHINRSGGEALFRRTGSDLTGCSKYCIGIANIHPNVKTNNFKPLLCVLDKIMRNSTSQGRGS